MAVRFIEEEDEDEDIGGAGTRGEGGGRREISYICMEIYISRKE